MEAIIGHDLPKKILKFKKHTVQKDLGYRIWPCQKWSVGWVLLLFYAKQRETKVNDKEQLNSAAPLVVKAAYASLWRIT